MEAHAPQRHLATFREICALLRISRVTGHRWRNDPAMHFPAPIRLGRTVRFDLDEIERWLNSRVSKNG
jgi:excisionase family DNA binding protein